LECIQLVKGEGPEVGFVTSGKGLTRERASALVLAGLDFIGFSIAGTTEETHRAIRVNSHLPEVVEAIRFIQEEKERLGRTQPRMHLVFLMVKDNVSEVPRTPSFARGMGLEEVVLVNICHIGTAWHERQRVFAWNRETNPYQKVLDQAERNARRFRIKLSKPSLSASDVSLCAENPLRNLYIASDGSVSPCVYLYPPLPSPFKRTFCHTDHSIKKVSFGNIFGEPFPDIWNSEGYIRFRNCFIEREKRFRDLYLSLLESARPVDPEANLLPDPPECCRSCHKMIGV
jgi:MoaA/NifB/PqqE/SkfB family radical SAM enzyme